MMQITNHLRKVSTVRTFLRVTRTFFIIQLFPIILTSRNEGSGSAPFTLQNNNSKEEKRIISMALKSLNKKKKKKNKMCK